MSSPPQLVIASPGGAADRVVALDRDSVVLGRHPGADVRVDHPAVGLRHARFRRRGDRTIIEDLGAPAGTTLNGAPVAAGHPRFLVPGDELRFGPLRARFDAAADPSDDGPLPDLPPQAHPRSDPGHPPAPGDGGVPPDQ